MKPNSFPSSFAIAAASVLAAGSASAQCLEWRTFPGSGAGGLGLNSVVYSLCSWDDGGGSDLYAIGQFTNAGGNPAQRVARWDGTGWSALPLPFDNPGSEQFYELATFDRGFGPELYAGGAFTATGGYSITRWNGSAWSGLTSGTGGNNDAVHTMLSADLGSGPRLYVGGRFTFVGPMRSPNVGSFDGTNWSSMGVGVNGAVLAFAAWGSTLYVGGTFTTAGGVGSSRIARWNGAWQPLGGLNGIVDALVLFDDGNGPAMYMGGTFTNAGGVPASCVVRWNGSFYSTLGAGLNAQVLSLEVFDDGSGPHLYAGGNFTASGSTPMLHVARWSGATWEAVGGGVDGAAWDLLAHDDGSGPQLFVGGLFQTAATYATANIAAWRGCDAPIERFCFGDGTFAPCPCRNHGLPDRGCDNSINTGGASLDAIGATNPDTLQFDVSGELPNAATLVFQGSSASAAGIRFGDGLRCASGTLLRLYTTQAVGGALSVPGPSDPTITSRAAVLGDVIVSGSVRVYQAWYRDADPSFCMPPNGAAWNLSNAVRVVW